MDFFELTKKRFSARSYLSRPIEKEKLEKILAVINSAPSAGNLQSYKVAVIEDRKKKQELAYASGGQDFIAEAPIALVFLADLKTSGKKYGERGMRLYSIQDATIAAAYAQLGAAELGLASVWVGSFETQEVMRIANAGEYEIPVAIIPVGYTDEKPERKERKKIADIIK